jgi:hypothetical protein
MIFTLKLNNWTNCNAISVNSTSDPNRINNSRVTGLASPLAIICIALPALVSDAVARIAVLEEATIIEGALTCI